MNAPIKSGLSATFEPAGAHTGERDGWQVALSYAELETELDAARGAVALCDRSAAGKLWIQGAKLDAVLAGHFGAAPKQPTDLVVFDGGWLTQVNRHEYYAVVPAAQEVETIAALQQALADRHAHVTSISHGRDAFALVGPRAVETLSKVCALDFRDDAFPDRKAKVSSLAKVAATVARLDSSGLPCYEVHVDRSYSEYVWEVVLDAASEFEGRAIGPVAFERLGESASSEQQGGEA